MTSNSRHGLPPRLIAHQPTRFTAAQESKPSPSPGIRITPFDEATLDHFIFLERPDGSTLQDGQGFTPTVKLERDVRVVGLTPSSPDYETVGEFYSSIRSSLLALSARLGEAALLSDHRGSEQLGPEIIDLPGLTRITDLGSALSAIDMVVEEGEGSASESHDSHFARFSAIKHEWTELKALNPAFQPAHPAAYDPVMRRPADLQERTWITDTRAVEHLDLASALYRQVLVMLVQAYTPGAGEELRRALVTAAISLMQALTVLGIRSWGFLRAQITRASGPG